MTPANPEDDPAKVMSKIAFDICRSLIAPLAARLEAAELEIQRLRELARQLQAEKEAT